MTMTSGMYSSARDDWETPQGLFDVLDAEFHFETDVCANMLNAKCPRFYTPAENGLAMKWEGVCWLNPPYGRHIGDWIRKAYESAQDGATVVCLLPARTDTRWFHDYCLKGEIRFLRGWLYFSNAGRAPFPSIVVVFRPVILGLDKKLIPCYSIQ